MNRLVPQAVPILFLAVSLLSGSSIGGQDVTPARTARNIRAKKLAQNWKGEIVTLTTVEGTRVRGRLLEADFYRILMEEKNGNKVEVPLDQIAVVILSPGAMELILTGVTGLLAGGFTLGLVTLTADATTTVKSISALVGVLAGTWLGYQTFYQEEIIELE